MKISVYNDSGETIPPYAVLMQNGVVTIGGLPVISVTKPDTEAATAGFLFNGPDQIPAGKTGRAIAPISPQWVKYDTLDTPVSGATWGPITGDWSLGLDGTGFRIAGGHDSGRVLAQSFCEDIATDASSCDVCDRVDAGSLTVDLGGGFMAAEQYLMSIRCGGSGWLFTHASGTEFSGESDDETAPCDGESPITLTGSMNYSISDAGGLVATFLNGGTPAAVFESETAWQPCTAIRMILVDYDKSCQCVAWLSSTCLIPVPAV